ncbi:hypothetical protein KY284_013322 [Solanum tuberosum]|nr:hypothetical protein KY284_013322 [Solanum tuberosum]
MEITLAATSPISRLIQKLTIIIPFQKNILLNLAIIVGSLDMCHVTVGFEITIHLDGFGDPKELQITLTLKDPKRFGYLRGDNNLVLQEQRKKTKGKWYLDSGCSNHTVGDKNLFKSVDEYKGGNICFGDNSKGTKFIFKRIDA